MHLTKRGKIRLTNDYDPEFIEELDRIGKINKYQYKRSPFLREIAEMGLIYYKKQKGIKVR